MRISRDIKYNVDGGIPREAGTRSNAREIYRVVVSEEGDS